MHIFSCFIPVITFCFHFSSSSQELGNSHEIITSNIFAVLHERFMVGLILVSFWEEEGIVPPEINLLKEVYLPYAIIGRRYKKEKSNLPLFSKTRKKPVVYRYNKPYFVHTNAPLLSRDDEYSVQLWTKMCSILLGLPDSDKVIQKLLVSEESNENAITASLKERLFLKDFYLSQSQQQIPLLFETHNHNLPLLKILSLIPINSLWLVFNAKGSAQNLAYNEFISYENSQELDHPKEYFSLPSEKSIIIFCPFCSSDDQTIISSNISNQYNLNITGKNVTKLGYLVQELQSRLNNSLKMEVVVPLNISIFNKKLDSIMVYDGHKISNNLVTSTRSLFYNPLVFISRKSPSSGDPASVLNPFTIASWIGLVVAYAVTTIAFGVIKAITMSNFDQSLYEYVIQQIIKIITEHHQTRKKSRPIISNKCRHKRTGTDGAEIQKVRLGSNMEIKDENNNNEIDDDAHHGNTSKAILHGTIRIVSFVMIATYEGKLYNSITFPKSRLISTFEDLLTSEPYTVKVTKDAEQNGLAGLQFDRFMMRNESEFEIENNRTRLASSPTSSKIINSVNIEDCINWVESSTDPNHACIGYEFELRNLHKSQRFDKYVSKSNKKLGKYSYGGRRRGSRLFPGAFQISRWIIESGIMQLWNVAENSFTESLNPDKGSQSKVFTVRDYLGLFILFFILLFLALMVFLFEVGIVWARKNLCFYSIKEYLILLRRSIKRIPHLIILALLKWKLFCLRFVIKYNMRSSKVTHC